MTHKICKALNALLKKKEYQVRWLHTQIGRRGVIGMSKHTA